MSKKDEHRELTKTDPFLETLQKLSAWIKSHQSAVVASVAVVVVGAVGATLVVSQGEKKAENSSAALADAQKTYDKMPLGEKAADVPEIDGFKTKEDWAKASEDKLNKVITDHPGSGAARFAELYLASLSMDKGAPEEAVKHYRAFIAATGAADPVATTARLGLASALEDLNKIDDAIKEYEAMVPPAAIEPAGAAGDKTKKTSPLAENALMNAARLYEAQGKVDQARSTYERVERDYPSSMSRYKAQQRLSALPKKEG